MALLYRAMPMATLADRHKLRKTPGRLGDEGIAATGRA
jgi:hypothetical protein